ncbi:MULTISPECIES: GTPase Era [unclassified Oceanispirochaeta]|uniref:GTPase Era n=1 Tax=unclassified Oceanispirochaeta TaxID=2635722 RepID=UPI000E08D164|nr:MULTISPECIES: GTPase Era [unclassified Oceanispirochaeta]MBF9017839.1 GTPase Era [Oceanispirochaeta sp. M2]NPD74299.1 GTPase Era [Oceanispirochaeta sp. M1]RDG29887.1 GTPase Era [Oceanispirochaeta sp. M1]
MKSAFVAIIGRPSAGKSTLLNALCREKVSITAEVPQTTRNKIRGIVTEEEGQLVFIDTPGYHNSERKFNKYLKDVVLSSLDESDMVLYVVDATRPPGIEEQEIIQLLSKQKDKPVLLVLNKADLKAEYHSEIKGLMSVNVHPDALMETSALKGTGVDALRERLLELAPEGELMYPEDFYTDQQPEFRIAEIIREKAISQTSQEIPHALYVEIADTEMKGNELWVRAFLTVESESQVGIVVGKEGKRIKWIRIASLKEFKKIFDYKVRLDLRVKVNPRWRRKDYLLKGMLK